MITLTKAQSTMLQRIALGHAWHAARGTGKTLRELEEKKLVSSPVVSDAGKAVVRQLNKQEVYPPQIMTPAMANILRRDGLLRARMQTYTAVCARGWMFNLKITPLGAQALAEYDRKKK